MLFHIPFLASLPSKCSLSHQFSYFLHLSDYLLEYFNLQKLQLSQMFLNREIQTSGKHAGIVLKVILVIYYALGPIFH